VSLRAPALRLAAGDVLQLQAIVIRSLPEVDPMGTHINARLPLRVEQKLTEYCAKHGVKRSETVLRALDQYLDNEGGGANAYSLAADSFLRRASGKYGRITCERSRARRSVDRALVDTGAVVALQGR
jgi:hypothetical protein